jgi:inner membrane protein
VEGPSHVVFGLAGAVVIDSVFHISGAPLLATGQAPSAQLIAVKIVYYGVAGLGALVPDIDNARSTLGRRLGVVSRVIQKHAGHREIFHSLVGLLLTGVFVWGLAQGIAYGLFRLGWSLNPNSPAAHFGLIALIALLIGYLLHLVADSLTLGGVPWLWPSHTRYGLPPKRSWRFRSGSFAEPVVVVAVAVAVIVAIFRHVLTI